jgi:RimJ/RimL family protein N-acetyltransferase
MASASIDRAMTSAPLTNARSAPTLETERLRLRGFRRDDLDAFAAMLAEPAVFEYLGGEAETREQSWRKLMMSVGQWSLLGIGYWVVETRADQRFVGQIGFSIMERGLVPDLAELPEMGWIFSAAVHGQGMALEAGRAASQWLGETAGSSSAWAVIAPENSASLRLAGRLGFARLADARYHDEPVAILHRD